MKISDSISAMIKTFTDTGFYMGDISDGYHTFDELYEFRKLYNALLFNEYAKNGTIEVYKSKRHHDGEECFGGGWFIVVAMLPTGQISNHYKLEEWNLFDIPEYEKSKYEFDGHTPQDVIGRMKGMLANDSFSSNNRTI